MTPEALDLGTILLFVGALSLCALAMLLFVRQSAKYKL
jgi:hypothetical protein